MLKKEDYTEVGVINKPHGIQGELNFSFNTGWMHEEEEYDYIFLNQDDCLVPYKIEELQLNSDEKGYIFLEDINSNEAASTLTGCPIYLPNEKIQGLDKSHISHLLIGFKVYDQDENLVGEVLEYIDIPGNPILKVKNMLTEHLLPFHEELILNFSKENKILRMEIPEGLLD